MIESKRSNEGEIRPRGSAQIFKQFLYHFVLNTPNSAGSYLKKKSSFYG
jgi:hypothetical protein